MKPGLLKRIFWLCALISACLAGVYPQTPTTLRETYKGRYDFVTTGGTLRAAANSSNACSRVTSSTAAVSGIPASATVFRAYLYWAGSGSAVDANITFDGTNHTADRTYTASLVAGSSTLAYFSGYRDVTAQVAAKRNGSYTFTNLTFTTADQTGAQYCALQGVVGGWGRDLGQRAGVGVNAVSPPAGALAHRVGAVFADQDFVGLSRAGKEWVPAVGPSGLSEVRWTSLRAARYWKRGRAMGARAA